MMRRNSAIHLIRTRKLAKYSAPSTSHNYCDKKRCFSRTPTIDFSSIHQVNDAIGLFQQMVTSLFQQMVTMSPQPSVRVYNKLLSVIAKMGEYSVTLSVFDKMRIFGVPADEYTMTMAINCYCLLNRIDFAFAILGSFFKHGYEPSIATFNTLLKGLYLVGNVAEAETLFEKVLTLKLCEPNDFLILTVINGLGKAGQTLTALEALQVFESAGYKPDVYCYSAVIDALSKDGKVDVALQLLSKMTKMGISPDVVTYSSIIQGLCKFGRWNEVKYLLLTEMVDHKVSLDVTGFNILVNAFCKEGKMEEAEDVLELVAHVNVCPDTVTYNALIDGYCSQGEMDKAREVFDSMAKRGLKPSMISYNSLNNGYCKKAKVDEAWRLFLEIPCKGLENNIITYNTMIHGFIRAGRSIDGWKLFHNMEALPEYGSSTITSKFTYIHYLVGRDVPKSAVC